jgi:alkylhydroperoxidase/carboxymuconolactone decarboxylase family protein YurZ
MSDFQTQLTAEQLAALQGGYSRTVMDAVATKIVSGPYPPSAGLTAFAGERFYNDKPPTLSPANRERCLLALFAGGRRPTFAVAVHIYWAMMEGVSVDEIAEIILLSTLYSGLDVLTDGNRTLTLTLGELAKAADAGGDAVKASTLLPALVAKFRT